MIRNLIVFLFSEGVLKSLSQLNLFLLIVLRCNFPNFRLFDLYHSQLFNFFLNNFSIY